MSEVFTFGVKSEQNTTMINITKEVQNIVRDSGIKHGICIVFIPHTTAAITINENADTNVMRDFLMEINKVIPMSDGYQHIKNSAAHIKSSLMGFSETIIIEEGRLLLGTWQGVYFMEFDGPRIRKVQVKIMEG